MRNMAIRVVAATGLLIALSACADSPLAPDVPAPDLPESAESFDELSGCVSGGVCLLPPVIVVGGGGDECDPSMGRCEEGGGECLESQPGDGTDVSGIECSGGVGGGGSEPGDGGDDPRVPLPPVYSDSCPTGDPAFDSPEVQAGLADLWERSNADASQAERREQAGWIIQRSDGSFAMAPFTVTAQGPCNINGNFNAPAGAVAWVHTHPFRSGEVQTICGAMKQPDPNAPGGFRDVIGPDGQPVYPEYRNKPSIPDRELMNDINATMMMLGRNSLAGVIIDANQTTVYSEDPSEGTTVFPRCGY